MKKSELMNLIEQEPLQVKIQGNSQDISLSCQGIEVNFPVVNHIFTRFVCSISQAKVIATGPLDEVCPEIIHAFTKAVTKRRFSSYDLMFKE